MPSTSGADVVLRRLTTSCRCCHVNCGMVVTVDEGERVLKIEGDRDHPISRGYTCGKGRSIPEVHHADTRLLTPRVRCGEVDWDTCLDDLGQRLGDIIARQGTSGIGLFLGTGGAYDTLGMFGYRGLVGALRTPQLYSVGTVDTAPLYRAAQLVTGFHDMMPAWVPEAEGPSLAILLGANVCVSHSYLGSDMTNPVQRLREYRQGGGEVWAIDPRSTKTSKNCDRHLALRPGGDLYLLAWLLREVLREGYDAAELQDHCKADDVAALRRAIEPFTLARAARQTGLAEEPLEQLLAAIRRHGRIAILSGTGISFSPNGVVCEWLRWALLIATGSIDREDRKAMFIPVGNLSRPELGRWDKPAPVESAGPIPASRPDLPSFYGEYPCAALADEIEAGHLRALIVFGGNPLTALPQPERVRKALASLEALVVIDPFNNEITQLATHALPACWQLERSDIRQRPVRVQFAEALLKPLGESKPGWWVFGAIADRLGLDIFGDGVAFAERTEETCYRQMLARARTSYDDMRAAGPHGVETPRLDGWFHAAVLRDRGWRIAPEPMIDRLANLVDTDEPEAVLVTGRVDFATNSMTFASAVRREELPPAIHLSPDLAKRKGIVDGDRISIATAAGTLEGTARVNSGLHKGTVWMSHGWTTRNVNRLFDTRDVDRLTVQPVFNAVPILLEKVRQPAACAV